MKNKPHPVLVFLLTVHEACHSELAKNLLILGKILHFVQDDNWGEGLLFVFCYNNRDIVPFSFLVVTILVFEFKIAQEATNTLSTGYRVTTTF